MILDQYGQPFPAQRNAGDVVSKLRGEIRQLRARYDAVSDGDAFVNHWANADQLSPDAANSYQVRRKLRSRSRFEVVENNPFLKGTLLTIANDFIGSGAKLQVSDQRLSSDARQYIERSYHRWCRLTRYRQKIWRLRMAKLVDGEGIKVDYLNRNLRHPVRLDFYIVEADRVTSLGMFQDQQTDNEVDGVRFDAYGNPTAYHVLDGHPGGFFPSLKGRWIPARFVTHWFRRERGWLRGIPETTPSLSLCALLRRYTLAVVKAAETSADFAAVLESEAPVSAAAYAASDDNPFDSFPIEQGMFTTLPWGYKLSQLRAEQPVQTYDSFVKAILMEIVRPLLVPYNLSVGSSQDSNMSSAVVDTHIYKESQRLERIHAEEEILSPDLEKWWQFFAASREVREAPEMRGALLENPTLAIEPPTYRYRWDRIGLDHTDPSKVQNALKIAHDAGFLTDRDIQETYHNRDVEEWREEYAEQVKWREENVHALPAPGGQPAIPDPDDGEA